jgi:hypothetical protein
VNLHERLEGLLKKFLHNRPQRRDGEILRFVKSLSLDCVRCRGLSPPVNGTADQYRCTKCKKQFSGPPHQIDREIWRTSTLTPIQKATLKNNYEAYTGQTPSSGEV